MGGRSDEIEQSALLAFDRLHFFDESLLQKCGQRNGGLFYSFSRCLDEEIGLITQTGDLRLRLFRKSPITIALSLRAHGNGSAMVCISLNEA